jgi:hypothetical protein
VGGTAMAKIIDILFPIAPLPKDRKERNAVIEGYQRSIDKPTNANAKGLLFTMVLLFIGIFIYALCCLPYCILLV